MYPLACLSGCLSISPFISLIVRVPSCVEERRKLDIFVDVVTTDSKQTHGGQGKVPRQ